MLLSGAYTYTYASRAYETTPMTYLYPQNCTRKCYYLFDYMLSLVVLHCSMARLICILCSTLNRLSHPPRMVGSFLDPSAF